MQECTLKVEGCDPVYKDGVCCPVAYECGKFRLLDHEQTQQNLLLLTTNIFVTALQYQKCANKRKTNCYEITKQAWLVGSYELKHHLVAETKICPTMIHLIFIAFYLERSVMHHESIDEIKC